MAQNLDPRHVTRALALQVLFHRWNSDFADQIPNLEDLLQELEVEDYDDSLLSLLIEDIDSKLQQIDEAIKELAPAWPINQIAPVDLTILRMGIWEAFIKELTPAKVVINEAIELGREFGGASSSAFINGVLGSLLKNESLQQKLKS